MKTRLILAGAMAALALTGCKKAQTAGPAASEQPVKITQASPPPGGTWTDVVNATPAGFMMGNPNAKVKLIEIGALTCPHCREFEEQGVPPLMANYVKTGQVSWEFRPYLLQGLDVSASLIASCNGPKTFFPMVAAMYKDQAVWIGKIIAAPQAQVEQVQKLPTTQQFIKMAELAGLQDWAAARGLPQAKSNQCLSDQTKINQLVQQTSDVSAQYSNFTGTPSFIINGTMSKDTHTWGILLPQLKDAVK